MYENSMFVKNIYESDKEYGSSNNYKSNKYSPVQIYNMKKMIINTIKANIIKNANKNNINNITLIEYNDISSNS